MAVYRRILVVVNPNAGQRKTSRIVSKIEEYLERENINFVLRETTKAGDALRWSRSAHAEGFDLVMVAGGDGTVLEAVEGLMRSGARVPLAQIPTGTVNVTARSISIPTDVKNAVALVTSGKAVRFDIGYLPEHDRYFVFVAGAGYDAKLIHDTPRELKKTLGFFAYVASGIKHFFSQRPVRIEIQIDGDTREIRAHTVMVINIGRIADLDWAFGPNIQPHDGKLNIMIMSTRTFWGALRVLTKILFKRYYGYSNLKHLVAERIRVTAEPSLPVQIDGEPLGNTPFLAEVIPNGIQFIVPKDYH